MSPRRKCGAAPQVPQHEREVEAAPAGTALLARDRGRPELCFQFLGVPELDDRLDTPTMRAYHDTPMWHRPAAEFSWDS